MSYAKPALVGLLVLLAIADCSDDSLDIPARCYEACDACCDEHYFEQREECKDACAISPIATIGFPLCVAVDGCPNNDESPRSCQVRSRKLR